MPEKKLLQKYPWLSSTSISFEEYLKPAYYDKILKKYIFGGKDDLTILKEKLKKLSTVSNVLELGPGTGRATETLLNIASKIKKLTLVDLSEQMLQFCKKRFSDKNYISYVKSDSLDFLSRTKEYYDFVFSIWSFSHSVHQTLHRLGQEKGREKAKQNIAKFIKENLISGGTFFIMHFDSLSDEQIIALRQRARKYEFYRDRKIQSPSKILIDSILTELKNEKVVDFNCHHLIGESIEFKSLDEALEYYMNFHMESLFNNSGDVEQIIEELSYDIAKHKEADGVIRIKPACFVYEISRK